jgi:hypothetical protein
VEVLAGCLVVVVVLFGMGRNGVGMRSFFDVGACYTITFF